MQLSKIENLAYSKLKESNLSLFKSKDLCLLLGINKTKSYNIIKALKKKGTVKRINSYLIFSDANEMAVASEINSPSYISFWSALNYYGFSDQMPKKIFLTTTKYKKEVQGFKYITMSKKRFFGYMKIKDITIAEKEKAVIDSLLLPRYSGGMKEVMKSIKNNLENLDIKKLIDYAVKMKSKSVLRRLGYILEKNKKNTKGIINKIGGGYELFDPNLKKKNNLNKKWLLDINVE